MKTEQGQKIKLNPRDFHFLLYQDEKSTAARMFITVRCLRLWVKLGLPYSEHQFRRHKERFFKWAQIWEWFNAKSANGDGTNLDMVWKNTPTHLQPKTMKFERDYHGIKRGEYWMVGVEGISREAKKRVRQTTIL